MSQSPQSIYYSLLLVPCRTMLTISFLSSGILQIEPFNSGKWHFSITVWELFLNKILQELSFCLSFLNFSVYLGVGKSQANLSQLLLKFHIYIDYCGKSYICNYLDSRVRNSVLWFRKYDSFSNLHNANLPT